METLPAELLLDILLNLEHEEIVNFCKSNKRIARICNDFYFWNQKSLKDFKMSLPTNINSHPYQLYRKNMYQHLESKKGSIGYIYFQNYQPIQPPSAQTIRDIRWIFHNICNRCGGVRSPNHQC